MRMRNIGIINLTNFLGHPSRINAFHGKKDRLLVVLYNSCETWDTSGHPPVQQRSGRIFHHGFVKPPPVFVMFIYTWYPKQPFFIGCFSWSTPNYLKKMVVSPFPSIKKLLFRVPGRKQHPPNGALEKPMHNTASKIGPGKLGIS